MYRTGQRGKLRRRIDSRMDSFEARQQKSSEASSLKYVEQFFGNLEILPTFVMNQAISTRFNYFRLIICDLDVNSETNCQLFCKDRRQYIVQAYFQKGEFIIIFA